MKVLISLTSGLSDTTSVPAAGELTVEGNVLSLSWTQPSEGEETCGSVHQLSYGKPDGILHMKRTGDNITDLTFSGSARTNGILSTSYGDFAMEIETRKLFVPEELWQIAKDDAGFFPIEQKTKVIQLSYFLYFSGQDPMPNDIAIQIGLEKNEDKR